MPLPPLTPRTAVVGVVAAAWLGATLGLVDHVLTAPDPVTYFSGKVTDPSHGAPRAAAGVARLPQQLEHALDGGSTRGAKVLLITSPSPVASASGTPASSSPSPTGAAARAAASPSASPTTSPSPAATGSPTPSAAADPSATPSPAAVVSPDAKKHGG